MLADGLPGSCSSLILGTTPPPQTNVAPAFFLTQWERSLMEPNSKTVGGIFFMVVDLLGLLVGFLKLRPHVHKPCCILCQRGCCYLTATLLPGVR